MIDTDISTAHAAALHSPDRSGHSEGRRDLIPPKRLAR